MSAGDQRKTTFGTRLPLQSSQADLGRALDVSVGICRKCPPPLAAPWSARLGLVAWVCASKKLSPGT